MIESGLAPGMAITALAEQQDDPRFTKILDHISRRIHTGTGMSAAFALYPDLFPPTSIVLIRAGEEGGDIGGRLRRAGQLLLKQVETQSRIKQAITSPLITASACGFVLIMVVKLVFPKFIALYEQMDLEFPLISKVVFVGVGFINHPITLFLGVSVVLASIIYRHRIQQRLFNVFLRLPMTQPIVGKILCANVCETLTYLHKDGVPIHRALNMLTVTTPFDLHREKLTDAQKRLMATGSLSEALEMMDYFPPVFHSMLAVGEESGSMDELLAANQRLMEEEVENLIDAITAMLEPVVICVMGVAMAILFVGMFLPIYGILNKLGG